MATKKAETKKTGDKKEMSLKEYAKTHSKELKRLGLIYDPKADNLINDESGYLPKKFDPKPRKKK